MKLFDEIRKVLEHKQSLVCLLIDEVESIAFARDTVSGITNKIIIFSPS